MEALIIDKGLYRIAKETPNKYRIWVYDHASGDYDNWLTVRPTLESAFEYIEERKAEWLQ